MTTPNELLYANTHEWLKIEGDEAVVGITHFAQEQLGDLTFIDLPKIGTKFNLGAELAALESVKAASEVFAPIAGTVIAVNEELDSAPELINQDPYNKGWMVRLKIDTKPQNLLSAAEYDASVAH